jgi:hypothetical protein
MPEIEALNLIMISILEYFQYLKQGEFQIKFKSFFLNILILPMKSSFSKLKNNL